MNKSERGPPSPILRNHLYHMDCVDLFPLIPSGSVSMILTDPPYGISYQNCYSHKKHPKLEGDSGIDYELFAVESYRILQENAHAYFFTRFDCYPYHYQCLEQAGFIIKNCLIVEKGTIGGIGDLRGSYANNAEWVIFCQKGRRPFQRTSLVLNKHQGEHYGSREPVSRYKQRHNACWFGKEYPKSTYNSSWLRKQGLFHPTVKNVEFLSWLIQISSQPGELVFDGFMGLGSTALAAIQTGRDYLGAEIDRGYYETAQRRLNTALNSDTERG